MLRLPRYTSAVIGAACRLIGCIATLLVVRFELGRGLLSPSPLAVLQITLACVAAVLIGNVVKECAFALSERVVNGLGHPFFRTTRTLRGRLVSEIHHPDGTWFRYETWKDGAAWEWTERDGSCVRIESPAMTIVRATPPRTSKSASARCPIPLHTEARSLVTDRRVLPTTNEQATS